MKRFTLRLMLAIVLALPIAWGLGSLDGFWALAKSPAGHRILAWVSIPFKPLNGENFDDPAAVVMLVMGFLIAIAIVWGGAAAWRGRR